MKVNILKRLAALFCSLLFIVLIPFSASAQVYPSTVKVKWYYPESILRVEKNEESLVLYVSVNGSEQKLTLVFPSFGGFRLYGEAEGFFTPEKLNKIEYEETSDKELSMKAHDGTRVLLDTSAEKWKIDIFNNMNNQVARFAADQIWFGYQNGVLKKVKLECGISEGESLYGLGERFEAFNQLGIKTVLWNQDSWSEDGTSYKNIPILHSSVGYMLFFNSAYSAVADIGVTNKRKYSLDFNGPKFDMYFWTGSPLENIASYTSLTGTPLLSPKWAYRYWAGASGQTWESDGTENVLGKLTESLSGYKKLGITDIAALYGEGELSYNIQSYNKLLSTNTRMLAWTTPFQSRADMSYWIPSLSTLFSDYELPCFRDALNPWTYAVQPSTGTMDYSHPNALAVQRERWKKYLDWGLKGLMVDYGEYIPESVLAYNGMTGAEFHNFSSYYYSKVNNQVFSEKYGDDFVLFARNATQGSQVWAGNFSGDQKGTFDGMKRAVNAMLTLTACGFSNWGSDIGGYGATENSEIYTRWLQFGTFSPYMRLHGQGEQDPWHWGDIATNTFVSHYWLRENLLNKIYSSAIIANKTGSPVSKSMALSFPGNSKLLNSESEYMFCDDLLVCPITDYLYHTKVTLPKGNWFDLWTGRLYKGGSEYDVDAPLNLTPVFIRSGSVIPVTVSGKTLSLTDKIESDSAVEALVVTAPNGKRQVEYWSDKNTRTVYTSSADGNMFTVSADRASKEKVILAYGINASEVKVNGKALEKLDHMPESDESGYYVDSYTKTVIRLPAADWNSISLTLGGLLSKNLAENKKITTHSFRASDTKPENIVDGKKDTQWTVTKLDEAFFSVDLGKEETIDRVEVKWVNNSGYGKNYTVSVSKDGENWQEVSAVTDSDGMVDILRFDPVNARYVKVSDITAGGGKTVTVYDFGVYRSAYAATDGTDSGERIDMSETDDDETVPETKKSIIRKKRKVVRKGSPDIYYEYIETWVIVLGVVGGVLLIAGAIAAIILIKKKRGKKIKMEKE